MNQKNKNKTCIICDCGACYSKDYDECPSCEKENNIQKDRS